MCNFVAGAGSKTLKRKQRRELGGPAGIKARREGGTEWDGNLVRNEDRGELLLAGLYCKQSAKPLAVLACFKLPSTQAALADGERMRASRDLLI